MNKRVISAVVSLAMLASAAVIPMTAQAAAKTPQYQKNARQMEKLNRGGVVSVNPSSNVSTAGGVYLSWRLFGDESLDTCFNIYKDGDLIEENLHNTNYIDTTGSIESTYTVAPVVNGQVGEESEEFKVFTGAVESNWKNAPYGYFDIKTTPPPKGVGNCTYTENDAAIGDLDNDEEYELVLKWEPSNSKDASSGGTTGHMYLDGYELDPSGNGSYMWRIDMGPHVRSGAHETPFLVYDFDGDGKSEIVSLSGPGAIDGTGEYVTAVGDTDTIKTADNTLVQTKNGKNIGPEYYTIFDGETGAALYTTDAIPLGRTDGGDWGDVKMQRSPRYLAGVAYLDGIHPSIVMCRGYYNRAVLRAYTWDGTEMAMQWEYDSGQTGGANSLYGQGYHCLSVADVDNDGRDEIIYGSAVLDDDGTVQHSTGWGHGDALHVSDFDNDGKQEIFGALEKKPNYGIGFRKGDGTVIWHKKSSGDDGRGVMANFSEEYGVLAWDAVFGVSDINGDIIQGPFTYINSVGKETTDTYMDNHQSSGNFNIFWDGDLLSEHYDKGRVQKWDDTSKTFGRLLQLPGVSTNNDTKYNPCLQADIYGDWREELIMRKSDGGLRVFTSLAPTDYMLPTLMHDSQYRCAVAWQNIAYNQPPHTSYFVGKEALATDENGNTLNYLAPAVPYTNVTYDAPAQVDVTGIEIKNKEITVEQGKTAAINAVVLPDNATKKGITWSSSDESVATVSNGTVKGVGAGKATITATTKDKGFTATCEVTVFATPVTGVTLSDKVIELGIGNTAKLTEKVYPEEASDKSVTWSSDDTSVAKVTSDGVVTGVGYGKTTVTATAGGKTAQCIVKVKPMSITDATGDDVFKTTNTDAETVLSNATATSGLLTQTNANVGGEFHKDFEVIDKSTAKLSFHLVTGGIKGIGAADAWNWTGHEYTMGIKLADENGNNIITVYQPYAAKATDLMSVVREETPETVTKSGWSTSGNVSGNIQGSAKRWVVDVEFDYDNDTCTMTVNGAGQKAQDDGSKVNTWESQYYDGKMVKTISLNGAKFKTLQCYTVKNGTGTISAVPNIDTVSYTSTERVSGNTDVLYEKGTDDIEWTNDDLTDWVQTGTDTAALALDGENGRIWYNPTNPATAYSATKTIDGIADDGIVSYDVDWYFGLATGRTSIFEYIQFGDKLRIGYTSGYYTLVSTDGGETYDGLTDGAVDGAKSIFTGEKGGVYTKNVKVTFDKKNNTIVSLTFDGKTIADYTNYELPDGAAIDSVSFGLQRGGGASNWEYPNGINRIRVAQFIEGDEEPDFSTIKVTEKNGKTATASYALTDYDEKTNVVSIIGALYNGDELVEVKLKNNVELNDADENGIIKGTESVEFNNDIGNHSVKVFMWNSLSGQKPFADAE